MNDTPTENPKLSFDQLQAINVTQKRLAVLESEIVNATKQLRSTKLEADRATKENIYQNELLSTVSASVVKKNTEATKLDEEILSKKDVLAHLNSEIATKSAEHTTKIMELKDREDKVVATELSTHQREVDILDGRDDLNNDIRNWKDKVAKLKEVISTF
jgi:chromosome segregation ATPase